MSLIRSLFLSTLAIAGCTSPHIIAVSGEAASPVLVLNSEATPVLELPEALPAPAPTQKKVPIVKIVLDPDRTIFLLGEVNQRMADDFIDQLTDYDDDDSTKTVFVVISSPGGMVFEGSRMIAAMKATESPITCVVETGAYSMAAMIFQHCDKRYMEQYSDIMYHQASLGLRGQEKDIARDLKHFNKIWDLIQSDVAHRMGLTLEEYKVLVRDEWWLSADDAYRVKGCDGIINGFKYKKPKNDEPLPALPFFLF